MESPAKKKAFIDLENSDTIDGNQLTNEEVVEENFKKEMESPAYKLENFQPIDDSESNDEEVTKDDSKCEEVSSSDDDDISDDEPIAKFFNHSKSMLHEELKYARKRFCEGLLISERMAAVLTSKNTFLSYVWLEYTLLQSHYGKKNLLAYSKYVQKMFTYYRQSGSSFFGMGGYSIDHFADTLSLTSGNLILHILLPELLTHYEMSNNNCTHKHAANHVYNIKNCTSTVFHIPLLTKDRKAFLLWPEPGTKLNKTYYIQIVDKEIAEDYSQVKCTFVDPSIPPEDATIHKLSAGHRSTIKCPEAKAMTEEGDIVVTCIKGNDEPGLYMYQLVMKMESRERLKEDSTQLVEKIVQNCLTLADQNNMKSVAFRPFETKGRNGYLKVSQLLLRCIIQFVDEMEYIKVLRIMSRNKKLPQQLKRHSKKTME